MVTLMPLFGHLVMSILGFKTRLFSLIHAWCDTCLPPCTCEQAKVQFETRTSHAADKRSTN